METPAQLKLPGALRLARIADRMSFLYLETCAISRDDNGVQAVVMSGGRERAAYLPSATLTCLLLGPGTSITQAAIAALTATGCAVTFTGAGLVRSYGAFLSPYAPTRLLLAQAAIVSDPMRREEAARTMYMMRFPSVPTSAFANASIEQMRGLEGVRMRGHYQRFASKARLPKWRRNNGQDPKFGEMDPVNRALNSANAALYGMVNAVVLSLGLSPGLGVIHTGNRQSFVLDIADLYKTELCFPIAFGLKDSGDPESDAMRALREKQRLARFLPRVVEDIHVLLGEPATEPDEWDVSKLWLWGKDGEVVAGRSQSRALS